MLAIIANRVVDEAMGARYVAKKAEDGTALQHNTGCAVESIPDALLVYPHKPSSMACKWYKVMLAILL